MRLNAPAVGRKLAYVALAALVCTSTAAAQQTATVRGRVVDLATRSPIAAASVLLPNGRTMLTQRDGRFDFGGVAAGPLQVRVSALGYEPFTLDLTLRRDTTLILELEPRAVRIDSVTVTAKAVAVSGVVIDHATGYRITHATIFVRPIRQTRTNAAGRFKVGGITPGDTVLVQVEALSYEPVSAAVIVERDTMLSFRLVGDPVGRRMIGQQITRLHDRARSLGYSYDHIDREALMRTPAASVLDVIKIRLHGRLTGVKCILIDDVLKFDPVEVLDAYPIDMIQRVEIISRGTMLRVYTTRYIQQMLEGRVQLRPIILIPGTDRLACS